MPKKPALLIAFLLTAMLTAGCAQHPFSDALSGTTEAPVVVLPQLELSPTPSLSPVEPTQDPTIESVVYDFFADAAENDWDSFVSRWTDEEQLYYRDFFAYADNAKLRNGYFAVETIDLLDIYEVQNVAQLIREDDPSLFSLPYDIWNHFDGLLALDKYKDARLWIAKVDCGLEKEFWDYRQGINYRVLTFVPENGQWKVLQDYQGYPGAGVYFGDAVAEEPEESEGTAAEETPNLLVDGTLHFTDSLTGYFIGTSIGDYVHVGIRTIQGDELWFWISRVCKLDPETLHRNQKIEVDWENRDVYIDEADEVINIDRIIDIRMISE